MKRGDRNDRVIEPRHANIGNAPIRHPCRKITILSCHRCLTFKCWKNEEHWSLGANFDFQVLICEIPFCHLNKCLHFSKTFIETPKRDYFQVIFKAKKWYSQVDSRQGCKNIKQIFKKRFET
jgi:hypothetical protein